MNSTMYIRSRAAPARIKLSDCGHRFLRAMLVAACVLNFAPAQAASDPFIDALAEPESAGIGAGTRAERSPYRGEGSRGDLLPVYLYEGRRMYLHAYRIGMKFEPAPDQRFDLFASHRFEGYSSERLPASLAGMARRDPGLDLGVAYRYRMGASTLSAEYLHDALDASRGSELRLGYDYDWRSGRFRLQPSVALAWRDAKLNNYYYGVRGAEAAPGRPAYDAGAGLNGSLGLTATYDFAANARVLASVNFTRLSKEIRGSPVVDDRTQISTMLGLMYDLSNQHKPWPEHKPVIVRALYGASTDCNFPNVVTLGCTSVHTKDDTGIAALEVGRTFVEALFDWPVSVAGFVGVLRHRERGFQPDFWQANAYLKAYYYGFPWRDRVKTRVGLGSGLAYANRIPMPEQLDQARRGRSTSKLLNYLDASADVSLGDIIGKPTWKETYLGVGVSHRSGIFGASQLLGNVNGGSNYLYGYLEWTM